MKAALAQINTVVGDLEGNCRKILAAYRKAAEAGAELVLTPELSIPGYPPRDLLDQPEFVAAQLSALKALAKKTGKAGLLVGYAEPNPAPKGRRFFNSAALLQNGKVVLVRRKTLIPDHDVFDENRHFEPAKDNAPFFFAGVKTGLSICEDAWNDEHFSHERRYEKDPVAAQIKAGAKLLLNMSASPFERGKPELRRRMIAARARRAKVPFLYCTLVGGNDELIFDGGSFAAGPRGGFLANAKFCAEDLVIVDTEGREGKAPEADEIGELLEALTLGLRDYLDKCGFTQALIGLSGGVDSALVCALAVRALGPGRVAGVAMPSLISSPGSLADAEALAKNLEITFYRAPIAGVVDAVHAALKEAMAEIDGARKNPKAASLTAQNIQARARGNLLMALSNRTGAIVLSTGNKSELSVGYCTLYGDMSGGLSVIADVLKTDVYRLCERINSQGEVIPRSTIEKAPSAELAPNQKDQDDLPPYEKLDAILRLYVEEGLGEAAIARKLKDAALVHDILNRVDRNEYKRRQAAPALRVSRKAFGVGRRMPIARGQRPGQGARP